MERERDDTKTHIFHYGLSKYPTGFYKVLGLLGRSGLLGKLGFIGMLGRSVLLGRLGLLGMF